MSEHTPTPYDFIPDLASGNTKIWADRECLGIIYQQGYADSSTENAEFIVRACNSHDDLLAALKHCRDTINFTPPNHFTSRHKASVSRANKAIAKAEGLDATLADTRKNWTPNEWTRHTVISDGKEMSIRPRED